jgi:hypothetical protein
VAAVPVVALVVLGSFAMQGRYLLPLGVLVALLAGETLVRNQARLAAFPVPAFVLLLAVGAAAVHLLAWYWNARRFAVGIDGPLWFVPHAEWAPAAGWWPWLLAALAGSALLVAAASPWVARLGGQPRDAA